MGVAMKSNRDLFSRRFFRNMFIGAAMGAVLLSIPAWRTALAADATLAGIKPGDTAQAYSVQIVRPANVC